MKEINAPTHQRTKAPTHQSTSIFLCLLCCVMIFTVSCSKDSAFTPNKSNQSHKTVLRSGSTLDTAWIFDFQDYLIALRDGNSTAASYTSDEAEYGIETLINIEYSRYMADSSTTFLVDTLSFNSSTENDYDLFEKARNSIEEDTLNNHIVAYDLELDTTINGVSQYISTTITSGGSTRTGSAPQDCAYFSPSESYYFGAGEFAPDEASTWLKCYEHSYPACGGMDDNGHMITTAIMQIQKKFNTFNPEVYCPDGENSEGHFIRYIDIRPLNVFLSWYDINHFPYNYYQCSINPLPLAGGLKACDCADALQLNSLYNVVGEDLSRKMVQKYPGYKFVAMNFATRESRVDSMQESINPIWYRVHVGKVFCLNSLNILQKVDIFDEP